MHNTFPFVLFVRFKSNFLEENITTMPKKKAYQKKGLWQKGLHYYGQQQQLYEFNLVSWLLMVQEKKN